MKSKNLFLVNTEYQLFLALIVILKEFSDTDEYQNTVLLCRAIGGARVNMPEDRLLINADFRLIETNFKDFRYNPGFSKILEEISREDFSLMLGFFEHDPIYYYFAYKLTKKGAKICLGQDGMKAYSKLNRFTLFARMKKTFHLYRFLKSQRLLIASVSFVNFKFGYHHLTRELWLTNPERYTNWSHKDLHKIETSLNEMQINALKKAFNFDSHLLPAEEGILFYLNQPLEALADVEFEILHNLSLKFPDKPIAVKIHPLTTQKQKERLMGIKGATVFMNTIPAELYITTLKNSVIFSFWSTALLFENRSCNFYWLHPFAFKNGAINQYLEISNPTGHIIEIDDPDRIKFASTS